MAKKNWIDLIETGDIFIVFSNDIVELENGRYESIPYVAYIFEDEIEAKEFVDFYNKKYNYRMYYYESFKKNKIVK